MRLDFKTKFAYGLVGVGDATFYTLIGTFLLFYLNTVVGISPAIAGTISAVGALWETFCGALVGYISDRAHTRWGRRKPFLMAAAFPLGLSAGLLFTYVEGSDSFKIMYYGIMLIFFWTAFSFFFVPYYAWGAELTDDYGERTTLRGYAFVLNSVGMAFGMVLPTMVVDYVIGLGWDKIYGWQAVGYLCGMVGFLTIFIGGWMIKDRSKQRQIPPNRAKERLGITGVIKEYREILSLKALRYVVAASILYLIGYAVFVSSRMYFMTFNLGLSPGAISLIMAFLTFASLVFVPPVSLANRFFDKRTIYIYGISVGTLIMFAFRFIGFGSWTALVIFGLAYSICNICYWQLVPAMIYDVCEVDQLVYDKKRAGIVISLQTLSESGANAIGLQLTGIILELSGFVSENFLQTDRAMAWTFNCFTVIPAVLMFVSAIMIIMYPIKKANYQQILQALADREEGKAVNMDEFKKII